MKDSGSIIPGHGYLINIIVSILLGGILDKVF